MPETSQETGKRSSTQLNETITGFDLGVGLVVGFWIYGLCLPIHAVYAALRHRQLHRLLAYLTLQALARIPRDSPVMSPFRKAYRFIFDGHFPDHQWITPDFVANKGPKRLATIAGPHGLFSLALNRTMTTEADNVIMFVDNNLAVFNPFIKMFAKWTGMLDLQGLKHTKVQGVMQHAEHDVLVVAGGFVEAAVGTQQHNRICRQMWPYWVKQCLHHGYDLSFLWILGGTEVFHQSESSVQTRFNLASLSLPAITPIGKFGLPIPLSTPLRIMNFKIELPSITNPSADQVDHWVLVLERRVQELIREHSQVPEQLGVAPVEPFEPWRAKL